MNNNFILRVVFSLSFLFLVVEGFGQQSLHELIRNGHGVSKHFITLMPEEQVPFDKNKARDLLELDPNSNLVVESTDSDRSGMVFYRYHQTYKGYPIESSMYIVHTKNNRVTGLHGSIVVEFPHALDAHASLSPDRAIAAALAYMPAGKYAWQDSTMQGEIRRSTGNPNASYYPEPQLVWYNPGDSIQPADLKLAYKIDVYSVKPLDRKYIFVDAHAGTVLGFKQEMMNVDAVGTANTSYSGVQNIHSNLVGGIYYLQDVVKGNGINTFRAGDGSNYTSAAPNWQLAAPDIYALDAHFGVEQTWLYYSTTFNRNSVDNHGYALNSYVNDLALPDNAQWTGSNMHYGIHNGEGVTAIDVTGHELTHGVTQYTSKLNYSGESGAMNESMSDIMGKSVQFFAKPGDIDWDMGNDMNWILRSMANPKAFNQPNTYHGQFWYSGSNDNGGVHTNSGVGNFMFFLLVNGGCAVNDNQLAYKVTGLGLAKADQIIYRTETVYLTPTSQYADWRSASILAASDLYGASSFEVTQVENAWAAVGVGPAGILRISGSPSICTSVLYTIPDLPANATVTWSIGSGAGPTLTLQPNGNTLTVINHGYYTVSTTLTANVTIPGSCNPNQVASMTIYATNNSFSGVINQGLCYNTEQLINQPLLYGGSGNSNFVFDYCPAVVTFSAAGPALQVTLVSGSPSAFSYSANTLSFTLNGSPIGVNIGMGASGGCQVFNVWFMPRSDSKGPTAFKAWPVPASGSMTVSPVPFEDPNSGNPVSPADIRDRIVVKTPQIRSIRIFDVAGRLRKSYDFGTLVPQAQLDVSDLASGIYFMEIFDGKKSEVKKILVRH